MRTIRQLLFFSILQLLSFNLFAQTGYDVTGTVTNDKGEPLKGATVFIGGSERVTGTDESGRFRFAGVPQGTFQLSAQLMGYAPLTRNIIVKNAPLNVGLQLTTKIINLQEVTIGKKGAWASNFKLFKDNFLGRSDNAKQSVILNPKVISFSTRRGILLAEADELLIIENKRLGYRLHYQLEDFGYNSVDDIALYHGECSFEQIDGTEEQKKLWAKNRLEAYQGSFMHFLRAVYANTVVAEGFVARPYFRTGAIEFNHSISDDPYKAIVKNHLVRFDSLVTATDTNFASFKFKQLYVQYDPKKAAGFVPDRLDVIRNVVIDKNASILKLATQQAIIDKKGSFTDNRNFFIQGYWARARVGDQLPVEYQPPHSVAPRRYIPSNTLLSSLQKWTDSIPQEKAYLHLDKPYYVPGDTIWFKTYLTTGSRHQLSTISSAVYVDLINDQNQMVKTLKFPVDSGTIAGTLPLGEDVKAGSYRLRAYTQWMRNAGEDYFFDRAFTIGDPKTFKDKQPAAKPSLQQTDVQFFPEGGNLVNGISSRVGFKAVGTDGAGVAISGVVTDNDRNEVARINTLHAGMGNFLLKPLPGKTYTATIKFTDSTTKTIDLPPALNQGYVLSVYQPNKDSVLVRIQASPGLQHSAVDLIAHSSGEIIFTSRVEVSSAMTSIWLDNASFPSGIAQFTIFDTNSQPLNERIAFIKGNDHLQLDLKTEKPVYKSREAVTLNLGAKDGEGTLTSASLSIAVTDENKVPVDEAAETTIFSSLLLSQDIKGYIERPNYYFTADTGEVSRALDDLMLTQGYRRFEWRSLASTDDAKPAFKPEGRGTTITGSVTTLTHQPLPNASVMLTSLNARINKNTTTDADGKFRFDNLAFPDSAKFAVQAKDAQNSDKVMISIDSVAQVAITPRSNAKDVNIIREYLQKAEQEGKPAKLTGLHLLKEVDIRSAQNNKQRKDVVRQGMFNIPEGSADKVLTIPDPEHYLTLEMFMQASLPGIRIDIDPSTGYKSLVDMRPSSDNRILLVLNGRITGGDEANDILTGSIMPDEVAKIEVVRTNEAMKNVMRVGNQTPAGYVLVLTKPASVRKQYTPNIANIMPKGFNRIRKFYSPRYDHPEEKPDQRTTIYWDPYVRTDLSGKTTVNFFNADTPGTYRVVVEGINAAGELGRRVFTYKVE